MEIDQSANPEDTHEAPTGIHDTYYIDINSLEASAESLQLLVDAMMDWPLEDLNIANDFFDTAQRISSYYMLLHMAEDCSDTADRVVEAECTFLEKTIEQAWKRLVGEWKSFLEFRGQGLEQGEPFDEKEIADLLEACQLPVDDNYASDEYINYQHRKDECSDDMYDDEYTTSRYTDDDDDEQDMKNEEDLVSMDLTE
ncbi:hypothetical protein FPHYL_12541 [Fusarium phyllophilum]|uniref:Uncharacterized protein n=1 Tax=Fusarium phyllophilum TaxID=47803 RepID=A0A8H5IJF8_9HYPO|nr:hypothetical protein FPHYL_12541 [Fusarium phyllophilum]